MKAFWTALLVMLALLPPAARSHSLSVAHLDAKTERDGRLVVDLDVAVRDLALEFPLDATPDERITWDEIRSVYPEMAEAVANQVRVSRGAIPCALEAGAPAIRRYDDGAYVRFLLAGHCPEAGPIAIDYGLFFDRDPQHRVIATLHDTQGLRTVIGTESRRRLGDAPPGAFASGLAFLREGIAHILVGYDHLAFVLLLLLPAVLRRERGDWVPAPSLRSSLWQVATIVTAFTVAHSVTLILSAAGWISPQGKFVEVVIAASVVLAAVNNIRPLVTRRLAAVGFGFGLIHGFGFAGALGELGLPDEARLAALVGFNLGVELGQLAVVAAVLPVLYLCRKQRWYAHGVMQAVSLGLGAVAVAWVAQRIS